MSLNPHGTPNNVRAIAYVCPSGVESWDAAEAWKRDQEEHFGPASAVTVDALNKGVVAGRVQDVQVVTFSEYPVALLDSPSTWELPVKHAGGVWKMRHFLPYILQRQLALYRSPSLLTTLDGFIAERALLGLPTGVEHLAGALRGVSSKDQEDEYEDEDEDEDGGGDGEGAGVVFEATEASDTFPPPWSQSPPFNMQPQVYSSGPFAAMPRATAEYWAAQVYSSDPFAATLRSAAEHWANLLIAYDRLNTMSQVLKSVTWVPLDVELLALSHNAARSQWTTVHVSPFEAFMARPTHEVANFLLLPYLGSDVYVQCSHRR